MLPTESKPEEIFSHSTPMKICVRFVDEMIGLEVCHELLGLLAGRNLKVDRSEIEFTMQYVGELAILLVGMYRGDELSNYNMSFSFANGRELLVIELEYN